MARANKQTRTRGCTHIPSASGMPYVPASLACFRILEARFADIRAARQAPFTCAATAPTTTTTAPTPRTRALFGDTHTHIETFVDTSAMRPSFTLVGNRSSGSVYAILGCGRGALYSLILRSLRASFPTRLAATEAMATTHPTRRACSVSV